MLLKCPIDGLEKGYLAYREYVLPNTHYRKSNGYYPSHITEALCPTCGCLTAGVSPSMLSSVAVNGVVALF